MGRAERPVLKQDCFALPEIVKCNPDGHQTDPIAVQFSSSMFDQRLLAMADYDGYISMVNTSEVLPDCINVIDEPEQNVKAQWVAHHNAINDLRFIKVRLGRVPFHHLTRNLLALFVVRSHPENQASFALQSLCDSVPTWVVQVQGDRQLLTAATDFNVRQWDTMTAVCVATMAGHSASVKCLSVHPVCSDVVASGVFCWHGNTTNGVVYMHCKQKGADYLPAYRWERRQHHAMGSASA